MSAGPYSPTKYGDTGRGFLIWVNSHETGSVTEATGIIGAARLGRVKGKQSYDCRNAGHSVDAFESINGQFDIYHIRSSGC
jgi:hypothetical protein